MPATASVMITKTFSSHLIVALDYPDKKSALDFVNQIDPSLCALKIGKGMFTRLGPDFLRELIAKKFSLFLDLKFYDIPNTVFDAVTAAAELGVWMVNVHISGGEKMLRAARRAIEHFPEATRPLLIGVTILTSMDQQDLEWMGIHDSVENTVLRMAQHAKACALDGVVCSAKEVAVLRKNCGNDFILVTPGICFEADHHQDQQRTMTPEAAIALGANYLVIGRSITQAQDPVAMIKKI